jgi:DNA-binding transcriptional MocR family regulator
MDRFEISSSLGDWTRSGGPLYVRLAGALRGAIQRGDVGAGARLPSERNLAEDLGVSRTTVVSAYALLRDEGLVESGRGSGTRVARTIGWGGPRFPSAFSPTLRLLQGSPGPFIDCTTSTVNDLAGLPDEAFHVDAAAVRGIASVGYAPLGLPELRHALARRYSESGLPTSADEILVTTGAQQGIDLLFRLFGRDHGTILVEDPTCVGALDAGRGAGATLVGLPVDDEGIAVRPLREALDRLPVRLLYVMASCQNPTGVVMTDDRRRTIARLAAERGVPMIDDMTMADLVHDAEPRLPLVGVAASASVALGSFSKLFWSGLRVGWVRAPAALIGRLGRLKLVADGGSSHVSQLIAAQLVPFTDRARAYRARQLSERLRFATALFEQRLPEWSWRKPGGGSFLWVRLPRGSAVAFASVALRYGVRVLPGDKMSTDGSHGDHLRISYVLDDEQLLAATERLAAAWAEFETAGASVAALEVVV